MVPPPICPAIESSGLGRSANLSADPRIQQVNGAVWLLPAWACTHVSVAISNSVRMPSLLLWVETKIPHNDESRLSAADSSGRRPPQPPLGRARVRLEALRARQPHGILDHGPRRGAVVDAKPRPDAQEGVDRQAAGRARRPAGRQDVIRSRAVVAQDFCGPR